MMRLEIFGRFLLYNEHASVDEKTLHSNKLVRLLVYILLYRDREVPHQELIDTFWQDEGTRNPEGALKNLIYRLRTELRVFGDTELVMTLPGAYHWNPQVPVTTDYEDLERVARDARSAVDPARKRAYCEQVIQLYKREVSARIATESWMLSRLTYYKLLYMDIAKMLAAMYEQGEEWDALERLCRGVMEVDSLDEDIHYWLIKSQIGKSNYGRAIEYYENGKKMFYDHLGIRNVDRFNELYDEIMTISKNQMSDIGSLIASVSEKEVSTEVFICEYPVFREIYRVEARRIRRTGIAEYVVLVTIKPSGRSGKDGQDARIRAGMEILEQLLKRALRTGDVVARYSSMQYVLLLPTCTYGSTLLIAERIESEFRREAGKRRLVLQFEVEELSAASGS